MEYRVNDNELIYMIRDGDDFAINRLFEKYKPLVTSVANSFYVFGKGLGIEFSDLMQEGYIGLYNAYSSFNEYSDVKFYTYALTCIRNHLNTYCRNMNVKKNYYLNNSISIDECESLLIDYYDRYCFVDEERVFVNIKNLLSFKCSIVFELKLNGFKIREISKLLDVPISTISGRISKINKTLRSYY